MEWLKSQSGYGASNGEIAQYINENVSLTGERLSSSFPDFEANEDCLTQQRTVRAKISVAGYRKKMHHGKKRVKLWRPKDTANRSGCKEKLRRSVQGSSRDMEKL